MPEGAGGISTARSRRENIAYGRRGMPCPGQIDLRRQQAKTRRRFVKHAGRRLEHARSARARRDAVPAANAGRDPDRPGDAQGTPPSGWLDGHLRADSEEASVLISRTAWELMEGAHRTIRHRGHGSHNPADGPDFIVLDEGPGSPTDWGSPQRALEQSRRESTRSSGLTSRRLYCATSDTVSTHFATPRASSVSVRSVPFRAVSVADSTSPIIDSSATKPSNPNG